MRARDGYPTHVPALVGAFTRTSGPVLELGAGDYSTPILHDLCRSTGRPLVTCEGRRGWYDRFQELETDSHHFHFADLTKDPEMWSIPMEQPWGLVVLDHGSDLHREALIKRLQIWSRVLLVHGAAEPRCQALLETFKYQRWVIHLLPWITCIASDVVKVDEWDMFPHPPQDLPDVMFKPLSSSSS